MLDLNRMPQGSSEGSIPFSNEPVANVLDNNELLKFPHEDEDDDEEEEDDEEVQGVNYFEQTQPVYAQPAISRPYDHPAHFRSFNFDAMNQGSYEFQDGPDDDPVDEFEVGQELADKEAAVIAVKTNSIRRAVEYKILESDRLKYAV
ncbi:hypothetical protein PIB30_010904 [Stylosanthes scabra]|uniref:Uncharacterized protein n=1 Tax=Stylosanthes scabra TaxID=79078 RepID=A0ABU6T609_9FABA|nr:hypothetical protein [Stylosanthes scabra]